MTCRLSIQPDPWTRLRAKETAMPSPARPCKRKAKPVDEDIWPERPKRTKCAVEDPCSSHPHTTSSPSSLLPYSSPSSLSPPPTSAAVSLSPDDLSQLGPIVVEPPGGFYCPMPGCGVPLPGNDAAWRGHFRSVHHKDLCADARAGSCAGKCRYACPLPKDDDDGHKCAMPMLVESIGRHLLNVHLGLRHQCPLCGKVEAQRLSACKRHIPVCPSLKATTKGGETPAQEEKKKSARKPRTRKACK
ncbi:hypothetical protein C8Q70DRAFT_219318 [Cubamyces menziesii]|nr:hypothetical protein C8Q70DRAFT_219318 [Cubamyces menziesii]